MSCKKWVVNAQFWVNFFLPVALLLLSQALSAQRIAVLSPAINEIVFELGFGGELVANTTHCDYTEESKSIPKLDSFFDISYEKIVAIKPDIVFCKPHHLEKLKSRGIKQRC